MRILFGVIGFLIFAASLPSASQTADDGRDQARVYFFDRTLKSTGKTYSCDAIKELSTTDKVGIVKGLNETQNLTLATIEGRSEFTLQRPADAPRIRASIESASQGLCQQVKHQNTVKAANAAATKAQLDAALARQNALNAQASGGTPGAGSSAGSAAGGLATGAALIGVLKEARSGNADIKKDAADEEAAARAKLNEMQSTNASDGKPVANTAAQTASAVNGAAGSAAAAQPNTKVPGSGVTQPDVTAVTTKGAVSLGDKGGAIDLDTKTIHLASADGATSASYTWDAKSSKFVSDNGQSLSTDEMLARVPESKEVRDGIASVKEADPKAGAAAEAAVGEAGASAVDQLALAQKKAMDAGIASLRAQNTSMTSAVNGGPCVMEGTRLVAAVNAYSTQLQSCSDSAIRANNFCTVTRSPKARQVQLFMTLASGLLAKENSASNNCRGAGYYAGIAQAGMVVANLACSGAKFLCDGSCASALSQLGAAVTSSTAALAACGKAAAMNPSSSVYGGAVVKVASAYTGLIGQQKTIVGERIGLCQKHNADILEMGLQILSLQQNRKEAKACKEALARTNGSGGTDGGTGNVADLTMDQLCAQPGQAAVAPCKCRNQPTAEGCPGFVADTLSREKLATNGAASAQMAMAGTANMANVGGITGSLTKMNGAKKSGLSAEAREALGLSDSPADANSQGSSFGGTSGTSPITDGEYSGSVASGDGSGAVDAAGDSKSAGGKKADSKDKFGKFESMSAGSMGGGFGGFGSFGAGKIDPKTGKKITEQQAAIMVQRKIAAQELQEQVTTASGKSNWDKVRERYGNNLQSLYDSP